MSEPKQQNAGREYLWYMLLAAALCVWAIKDGWFPSPKVLEKHPREVVHSFAVDGLVDTVAVTTGQVVQTGTVMVRLSDRSVDQEELKIKRELQRLQQQGNTAGGLSDAAKGRISELQSELESVQRKRTRRALKAEQDGEIRRIAVREREYIKSGEPIVLLDPRDSFYLFNKSLAVFSGLAAIFCGYMFSQWRK